MKNPSFEALHPRGADGRFIEKFGLVKFLLDAKWTYGKVQDITADDSGKVSVLVEGSDLSGKTNGQMHTLSPKQIYKAPKAKGFLKTSDPKAKKIGGQAGSNPGGLYELPDPESTGSTSLPADYKDYLHPSISEDFVPEPGQQIATVHILRDHLNVKTNQVVSIPAPRSFAWNEETQTWQEINKAFGNLLTKEMGHKEYTQEQMNNWKETFTYQSAQTYFKAQSVDWYAAPTEAADPGTNHWYVKKAKTKDHGRNEALANALYRMLGVPVPDVVYDDSDGNIYSRIVEGSVEDMAQKLSSKDKDWMDLIQRNFAIDAWLANWDVFGMTWDNVKTDPDGVPFRIDNGGALLYRAQGAAKGKDFSGSVPELVSFKTGKKAKIFGGITPDQELDGAQRILALSPEEIHEAVAEHGLPKSLADTLVARRASIAEHYGLTLPEKATPAVPEPVDIKDITKSGKKPRNWKQTTLAMAGAVLSSGDVIEIDGEQHTYGESLPGIPSGSTAKALQMAGWLSEHGADKQVWVASGDFNLERPTHGATMTMGEMVSKRWERGDWVMFGGVSYEVIAVNPSTGIAVLHPSGGKSALVYSLRHDSNTKVTVTTWDGSKVESEAVTKDMFAKMDEALAPKPAPVPEPVESPAEALMTPSAPEPEAVDVPGEGVAPLPAPEPEPEFDWGKALEEVGLPLAPQAEMVTKAVKADIEAKKTKVAATKAMVLGDGTEADTGSKVFSAKDNKTYLYVKKKGPYAVVTDPGSDEPDKQLLKLASTLGQPDKAPTADPGAVSEMPLSANGIMPQVGMMATAKDGHSGVITMVSPNGKFVFIQDAFGKKKRKSVGTVTIDDATSVETAPPTVSTTDEVTGQTTISAVPDLIGTVYGDVDALKASDPTAASWWPVSTSSANGVDLMAGVVYPDGSFGLEPFDAEGKSTLPGVADLPLAAALKSDTGAVAGFNMVTPSPMKASVLAALARENHDIKAYEVYVDGNLWTVMPTDETADLVLIRSDSDGNPVTMMISKDSTALMPTKALGNSFNWMYGTVELPDVSTMTAQKMDKPTGEFKSVQSVIKAAGIGDLVSLDGKKWYKITNIYHPTSLVVADPDNPHIIQYIDGFGGSGTTIQHVPGATLMETVVIEPKDTSPTTHLGYEISGDPDVGYVISDPSSGSTYSGFNDYAAVTEFIDLNLEPLDQDLPETEEDPTKAWAQNTIEIIQKGLESGTGATPSLAGNMNVVPGPSSLVMDDYISVAAPNGNVITGKVTSLSEMSDGGSWDVEIQTPSGTMYAYVPADWPVLLHGNLDSPDPTVMSAKMYAGMGIQPGQFIYSTKELGVNPDKPPMKVLGVDSEGNVKVQTATSGIVPNGVELTLFNVNDLPTMILYVSNVDPGTGAYPPIETTVDTEPEIDLLVDDSLLKQVKTIWDSASLTFEKPTNSTVWYDANSNEFVWQVGHGGVARVKVSKPGEQSLAPPMTAVDFAALTSTMHKVASPPAAKVTHPETGETFTIPEDHSAAFFLNTVWAIPKAGAKYPNTWVLLSPDELGMSPLYNAIVPDADVSDAQMLLDVDSPLSVKPPKVTKAGGALDTFPTPPKADWDDFPLSAPWDPEYVYAKDPKWNDYYLQSSPPDGPWYMIYPDGTTAEEGWPTYELTKMGISTKDQWTPAEVTGQDTIEIHGHTFGSDVYVMSKTGSNAYYVKSSPAEDWKILLSTGEILATSAEDYGPDGDPVGEEIWPEAPEPELEMDVPEAPAPVEPKIGGKSVVFAFADMQTETDPLVTETPAPGVYWLKANHPGFGSTAYYKIEDNKIFTYSKVTDGSGLTLYSEALVSGDTLEEKVSSLLKVMKPYIFTDITPGQFVEPGEEPAEAAPSWASLVHAKINPASIGYGYSKWKDPAEVKAAPPAGWTEAEVAEALEYATAYVGPGAKTMMITNTIDHPDEEPVTGFYVISPNGHLLPVGSKSLDLIPSMKSHAYSDPTSPVDALLNLAEGSLALQGTGYDMYDVSPESPADYVMGYTPGAGEAPSAHWKVPISPDWDLFKIQGNQGHLYRDKDGAWFFIDEAGNITAYADDDAQASDLVTNAGWKLLQTPKTTDTPGSQTTAVPVNVPSAATKNVATAPIEYAIPNSDKKITLLPGQELYLSDTGDLYYIKDTDGAVKASLGVFAGDSDAWVEWHSGVPETASQVDLKTSVPQATQPAVTPTHDSLKSSPTGAPDPSIFSKPPVDTSSLSHSDLPIGMWFGHLKPNGEAEWAQVTEGGVDVYAHNPFSGWGMVYKDLEFQPSYWGQIHPSSDLTTGKATPEAPAAGPSIPGAVKPSPEDITAWGGDLTKDGHIPTSGMKVKGKGPMQGTVLSVSKDKTKAVVLTEDGKKTTRLISALSVDHHANKKAYGPVTLPVDIPADMPFAADPPDVAIAKALSEKENGQMSGFVLANDGIRDSKVTLVKGVDKDGKPVLRAYFHMTSDAASGIPSALSSKTGEKGAWDSKSKQSQNVAAGDQIAMRYSSSSSKWKVDPSGAEPTHKVVKVEAGTTTGTQIVTLENLKTGETVTSNFHANKSLTSWTWDPEKPVVQKTGTTVLSAEAKADGWERLSGAKISTMKNGVWQPSQYDMENAYGSYNHETFKQTAADGTIIEVMSANPTYATDGFSVITVPAGEGTNPDKAILSALDRIGVGYKPPTQSDFKREVVRRLSTALSFNNGVGGIDHLNGANVNDPNDPAVKALFAKFGKDVGIPDIGWHDVLVGQDHRGDTTFYWSNRVVEAMEKKSSANVVLRAASNGSSDVVVSTVMNGSTGATLRVAEGFSKGTAGGSSDNSNFAAGGSYFSQMKVGKLPKSNSLAGYKGAGMMVYYRPTAVYRQIKDFRAAGHDAFGNPGHGTDSVNKALTSASVRDFYIHGGLNADDIGYIAVQTEQTRLEAIKKLKDKGITTIGGRPIEEVIITLSQAGGKNASDLTLPDIPPNAVPIEEVPMSYGGAGGAA